MSVRWVGQRTLRASHFLSATSQAGPNVRVSDPAPTNLGSEKVTAAVADGIALNELLTITAEGALGTATYKASNDGGTTTFGRQPVTVWDNGQGGGENTSVTILDDTDTVGFSRPVAIDTDGDGVLDRVLVAISRKSNTKVEIYACDDLLTGVGWAKICDDANTPNPGGYVTSQEGTSFNGVQLVARGGGSELFVSFVRSLGLGYHGVCVAKSTDHGVTWSFLGVVATLADFTDTNVEFILLANEKLQISYLAHDGANYQVYCQSSADGATWTATPKQVTTGATNKTYHAMFQDASGKTVCLAMVASSGIVGKQCTNADPAKSSATWATYSETLFGADASNLSIAACIGAEGAKHVIVNDSTNQKLFYSGLNGTGTFSALDTIADITNDICLCRLGQIGGALWCVYYEATVSKVQLAMSQYWEAYSAGANEAPTPLSGVSVLGPSGAWHSFEGTGLLAGDDFLLVNAFDYGAERMVLLDPDHPARSVADGAEWIAVFDLGANTTLQADTVCVESNVKDITVQMCSANDWDGTPEMAADVDLSHSIQSFTPTSHGAGVLTYASGAWRRGSLKGCRLYWPAQDAAVLITGNSATRIHYNGQDSTGNTGTVHILHPKVWASFTSAGARYLRVVVPAQNTPEGYYEIKALVIGEGITWGAKHRCYPVTAIPTEGKFTPDGRTVAVTRGRARNSHRHAMHYGALDDKETMRHFVEAQGSVPFALIWNDADATAWTLVRVPSNIGWDAVKTELLLPEA